MAQLLEDCPRQWKANNVPVAKTSIQIADAAAMASCERVMSEAAGDQGADQIKLAIDQENARVLSQRRIMKEKREAVYDGQYFSGYVPFQKIKPDFVQIKAGTVDMLQRIKCYQARKRDEVNTGNISEFCKKALYGNDQGCARANAVVNVRKDCKSHIKVHRVFNAWGPQTRGVDPGSIPHPNPPDPAYRLLREQEEALIEKMCGFCGNSLTDNCPDTIHERLENAELHLKIDGPVPRDIYLRIKQIEDRILGLEGISPEYAVELSDCIVKDGKPLEYSPLNKRGYSKYELKRRLTLLQNDLVLKRLKREKEGKVKKEEIETIPLGNFTKELKNEPTSSSPSPEEINAMETKNEVAK